MKKRIQANARFVYKSKTAAEWQAENPILLNGEIGFVSDAYEINFLKVGDGKTAWNDLPYKNAIDQDYDPQSERAQSGRAVFEALKGAEFENYVKKTDIANGDTAGVVKVEPDDWYGLGIGLVKEGNYKNCLKITPAGRGDIANKENKYIRPITSGELDYAILKGLTTNKETWTNEEKTSARKLIDAAGATDYPIYNSDTNTVTAGVIKTRPDDGWGLGIETIPSGWQEGYLRIKPADNGDIAEKSTQYRPITPYTIDYAVQKALTDCRNTTWNEDEKAAARTLLGVAEGGAVDQSYDARSENAQSGKAVAEALMNILFKGAITTESYYEETNIELEASTLYIFIHNSGSNNLELKVQNASGTMMSAIDCSSETTPTFQAGAVLVPKDIGEPLQLKADSQGNLTVYDYNDRTALLMGVTGKTLNVPQMATKQFYYDASNTGDKSNTRVNYGKMFVHNKTGSLTVWKIKL
ncbi:MAG: hypothetical protein Q4B40_06690 [Clostridia bacterium]|nr:hypothetical protein [Clostridia bacterium]